MTSCWRSEDVIIASRARWVLVGHITAEGETAQAKCVVKLVSKEDDRGVITELQYRQRVMQHFKDHGITRQEMVPTKSGRLYCLHETTNGNTL